MTRDTVNDNREAPDAAERARRIIQDALARQPQPAQVGRAASPPLCSIALADVAGSTIAIGDHITVVQIGPVVQQNVTRRYDLRPGDGHITDEQAARIQELVKRVVGASKRSEFPTTFPAVYSKLFLYLGGGRSRIPNYRFIPRDLFEKADKFLRTWRERLDAGLDPEIRGAGWRRAKLAYILSTVRARALEQRLRAHLSENYGTQILKELDDDDLQLVAQTVRGWAGRSFRPAKRGRP